MTAVSQQPAASGPWIQGPARDLLLGAGLLYLPILAFSLWAGSDLALGSFSLMPLLVLFIGNTHLGATLMRVYERREDRHAYRLFAVWVTIAIAVTSLVGLWVPIVGSVLITLYLTFVPWHFTGQNYGVSLIFLRRRGIEIDPGLKRYVWLFFFLSYLLWVLALHGARPGTSDYAPLSATGTMFSFLPLGIPQAALPWLAAGVGVAWIYSATEAVVRLRQRAPWQALLPTAGVALSQALWFAAPVLGTVFLSAAALGPLAKLWAPGNSASTFLWISVVHSAQYLWITSYYVRKERPGTTSLGFFTRSLLAAMAIFGLPLLVLSPHVGGGPSYEAGLYLMLAGALNVHHVVLDGVIWKLRNARIASILLRGDAPPAAPRNGRSWIRPAVFASGALGVGLMLGGIFETQLGFRQAVASNDADRIEASLARLSWLGRDHASGRARLGYLRWKEGDLEEAADQYERSLRLHPQASSWLTLARIRDEGGELRGAFAAYEEALDLAPDEVDVLLPTARMALRLGDRERARELVARAAVLAPERPEVLEAQRATGIRRGASL